jgi:cysteine-rich secretory family protein
MNIHSHLNFLHSHIARIAVILVCALLALLILLPVAHSASPLDSSAERILFDAANRDRAAQGLAPLQWDAALATAARQHAMRMAQQNALSHQLPGEPALQQRASQAGARFQVIAENVAEGANAPGIHVQWMNSAPHRANLLDPQLSAIGIAVAQAGEYLFAVEDFSQTVATLELEAQELQVSTQLASRGLRMLGGNEEARKTCDMDHGFAGLRPSLVMRYETADLRQIPRELDGKLQSGKFRAAAVGACEAGGNAGFAKFRIAVLLY